MKTYKDVKIEAVEGDITQQTDMEAIVNAANADLTTGGGVAGAIHRAAGPDLEKECAPKAPIEPGEAVITGGHELPNEHVIHTLGPIFGENRPESKYLSDCYYHALHLADQHNIKSVAFPAISTGAFGYPFKPATQIALETVRDTIPELNSVKHIRFVLRGRQYHEHYENQINLRIE